MDALDRHVIKTALETLRAAGGTGLKKAALLHHFVDGGSIIDVVNGHSDVVRNYPLVITLTAGYQPVDHIADFRELSELVVILEMMNMTCIVSKYFIEEQIAIGESERMDRLNEDSGFEAVVTADIVGKICGS